MLSPYAAAILFTVWTEKLCSTCTFYLLLIVAQYDYSFYCSSYYYYYIFINVIC